MNIRNVLQYEEIIELSDKDFMNFCVYMEIRDSRFLLNNGFRDEFLTNYLKLLKNIEYIRILDFFKKQEENVTINFKNNLMINIDIDNNIDVIKLDSITYNKYKNIFVIYGKHKINKDLDNKPISWNQIRTIGLINYLIKNNK